MQEDKKQRIRWEQKRRATSTAHVPQLPGLYAYGKITDVFGLEKERDIVYVGKTDNLRRRLAQHTPNNEQNPQLREYLHTEKNVICWYCVLDGLSSTEIGDLEMQMIKILQPKFCTHHNTRATEEGVTDVKPNA